jgi:O-antigen ligase
MRALKTFSAGALAAILFAGILTLWVPHRWAASLYQVSVFALAMVWGLRFAVRPFPFKGSPLLIPLSSALLLGLVQIATGRTVYPWETWMALLKWGTNLLLFFLALQVFQEPELRERFLRAALYFAAALGVLGCLQMYTSEGRVFWLIPTDYKEFVVGPFVYHNQYAGFVELILPLAAAGALRDRRRMLAYSCLAAALYATAIAAASRAGALLATGEIVVIVLLSSRRRLIVLGLLATLAIVFTGVAGWGTLWHRFLLPDPYAARREFLQSSLAMIRDRPWTGFGLGTWSTAYPSYAVFDNGLFANQAHNDWAQWTVEGGVLFLSLMLWIAARSAGSGLRSVWGIGVVTVFVHGLVDYPIERPALAGFFFAFLGVMEAARATQKKS